jgi:hypothetical protein
MTARKIELASNTVGQQGPVVGEQIGPEDDGGPDGVRRIFSQRLAEGSEPKMFGRCLLCYTEAGEGAEETVECIGIGLTLFREEIDAADLILKSVGNAEARGGEEYAAAGIGHGHFHEAWVGYYIADAAGGWSHDAPQMQGENSRGGAGNSFAPGGLERVR